MRNNKVEVIDDEVKEAKEEDNDKNKDKEKSTKNKNGEMTQQSPSHTREPLTPRLNSIIREVDGYIVLEESKLDSH